ncbi:unnamed protein product [Orchesella dallaii]|uniref:Uncharacterized protein n=1 Tax=Orchesella dallaii TaxID=48710 RepID=A0ABP1RMA9_9HEXA
MKSKLIYLLHCASTFIFTLPDLSLGQWYKYQEMGNRTDENFTTPWSWLYRKRLMNDTIKSLQVVTYPRTESLFKELIPDCTIYFCGKYDEKEGPLFQRLFHVCGDNCVQIVSISNERPCAWMNFNQKNKRSRFHPRDFNESFETEQQNSPELDAAYYTIFGRSSKYSEKCLVLVSILDKRGSRHNFSESAASKLLSLQYNGRISPKLILIQNTRCNMSMNHWSWDIRIDEIELRNAPPSIILLICLSGDSIYLHHYDDTELKLTEVSERLGKFWSLAELELLWDRIRLRAADRPSHYDYHQFRHDIFRNRHRFNLERDAVDNWLRNSSGTLNRSIPSLVSHWICHTPIINNFKMRRDYFNGHRIWDPQEECSFETIMSKYNFSGYSSEPMESWPIQVEFQTTSGGSGNPGSMEGPTDGPGRRGRFYIPVAGRFQGFHYKIFVDRKSIKAEIDMTSLLKPLSYWVWFALLLFLFSLVVIMKCSLKSFELFWLVSILLEQGVIRRKFVKTYVVCFLTTMWLVGAFQLRQLYSANMFSFITAERVPETPQKMKDLTMDENSRKFTTVINYNEAQFLFFGDRNGVPEVDGQDNGNMFLQDLWRQTRFFYKHQLKTMLGIQDASQSYSFLRGSSHGVKPEPRIAVVSYTHPNKLVYVASPKYPGEVQSHLWQPTFPIDTMLLTFGQRLLIPNSDDLILPKLWLYHGKRNFFTDYFVRDLESLVESGIYARWELLTCRIVETRCLLEQNNEMQLNKSWNFVAAACKDTSEKLKPTVSFRPVDNRSIRVIWVLFFGCLVACFLFYFREIVRFDIPGRKCQCAGCNEDKYKQE